MSWVNFELIRTGENYTGLCFTNFWKEYGPLYNIINIEPWTYLKFARWYYYSYDKSSSKIKNSIWAFLAISLAISIVIHWVFFRVALLHMILHVISASVFVFTMLAWKSHILKYGINFTHMLCMIWPIIWAIIWAISYGSIDFSDLKAIHGIWKQKQVLPNRWNVISHMRMKKFLLRFSESDWS